jgi:hypothetical protein
MLPIEVVRVRALHEKSEQATGYSDDGTGRRERGEFETVHVEAEAARSGLILSNRLKTATYRRMRKPPKQPRRDEDDGETEEVERSDVGKQPSRNI